MKILEKSVEIVLDNILKNGITNVTENECKKSEVDKLVEEGYLTKTDVSSFDMWQYRVTPTYEGENYFQNKKKFIIKKRIGWVIAFFKILFSVITALFSWIVKILPFQQKEE